MLCLPCVHCMCTKGGVGERAGPAEDGTLPTTGTDVEGSKPEPEAEIEPGSDKWQYVESPVPEVRRCACVCIMYVCMYVCV